MPAPDATAIEPAHGQRPLARRALYEEAAEQLRQRMFARQLEPGAWIDELKIAAEMGISRTPGTTIGKAAFDGRVRDGIGSDRRFMVTRKIFIEQSP